MDRTTRRPVPSESAVLLEQLEVGFESNSQTEVDTVRPCPTIQRSAADIRWPAKPRKLSRALHRPAELFLNAVSFMIIALLILYIIFLLVFDRKAVAAIPGSVSFLREISQLVSPTASAGALELPELTPS